MHMDHETAVKLMASERYLLGELSPDQRDAFEEHFFECAECAEDVRAAAAFRANANAVLRDPHKPAGKLSVTAVRPAANEPPRRRWFLSPAFAFSVACNFLLLILIGHQRLRVMPELRQEMAGLTEPQFGSLIVVPPSARGEGNPIAVPRANRFLQFRFELSPAEAFQAYSYEISGVAGPARSADSIAAPADSRAGLFLTVPTAGFQPGEYLLVLRGMGSNGKVDLSRTRFTIQH